MRSALWFIAPAVVMSGCTGWVVFGHTMGGDHPAAEPSAPLIQPVQPAAAGPQPTPMAAAATAPAGTNAQPAPRMQRISVGSVYIVVSPLINAQIAADARFDQQKLLAAVEQELQARRLLVAGDAALKSASAANRRMEITLDAFSTRASTNAVIFGYALGSGELAAEVHLRDAEGREFSGFRVQAKARLATRPAEDDPNPLGNLYRRFAVLAADKLAGVPSKPDESDVMPR